MRPNRSSSGTCSTMSSGIIPATNAGQPGSDSRAAMAAAQRAVPYRGASPNPACQSRWSQCGCVEKPAATATRPLVGDAGQLVAEHARVDEQDARPALHDHGVALQELALVDEHPVGDLAQHQAASLTSRRA